MSTPSKRRYSGFALLRNALSGNQHWKPAWRAPEPKASYDAIIIGGGGHGLATAYYLARNHGITNVAVLERGWIGGGNSGRNTTIVRSNYFLDENARFYEHSLKLWEGLSQDLNYNMMFSQRGVINLLHSDRERESWLTRYNALRLNGTDADTLSPAELSRMVPALDCAPENRFPIEGAMIQRRGGVARHDAMVWGYARAADALGVDILQGCDVTAISREKGRIVGVETSRGRIATGKVAICTAGNSGEVARMAGLRLPIESHLLQALVSEPVKPFLDAVVSSAALRVYVSQTDKGEVLIGGGLDGYNSYSQRGNFSTVEHIIAATLELFPGMRNMNWMRQWGGVVDMSMDGCPIISLTPVEGLYFDGGWCYGGFKATPGAGWCLADTMANDRPHPLVAPYTLERFYTGKVINERGRAPDPALH